MAWPVRYHIIGFLFLSTVVNYIDRVNISVAAPVIMKETGWDKGQFGLVFSAFLIGYALLQIPGGVIADRWGGRRVLALAFCGFSLSAMGAMGVAVYGAGFVSILSGGAISDRLLRTGWRPQFVRVRFPGIGVALSLPFLVSATLVSSSTLCVMSLVLFYLLFASAISGYTTVALEFNPHAAGAIFGLISMLGSFAGILGPMTAGFMLSQSGGNWTLPFLVAATVGAVCASILFVVPIRPIRIDTLVPAGGVTQKVVYFQDK